MVSESRKREREGSPSRPKDIDALDKDSSITITNVPYKVRWEQLKDIFEKEVGEVIYVKLFKDGNDRATGIGYVTFNSPALAKIAQKKLDRFPINDREIVVKDASYAEKFKTHRNDRDSNFTPKHSKVEPSNDLRGRLRSSPNQDGKMLYGLAPQFLASLGIDPAEELTSRVFVKNLDYKVDERQLRDVFQIAGRVIYVKILRDKPSGQSSGLAVIEYTHPVEAVQAISMFDSQLYFDRNLVVRFDRAPQNDPHIGTYVFDPDYLPEGLRRVGRGLGPNGMPLADVANNMPGAHSQPSYVNPVQGIPNIPPQQNPAINVQALEALGRSIMANQQMNVNATNSALSALQTVPGFQSILGNLNPGNNSGGNAVTVPIPSNQPPIISNLPTQPFPNVPMQIENHQTAVGVPNVYQQMQMQLANQENREKLKQEAALAAAKAHITGQIISSSMDTPKVEQAGGYVTTSPPVLPTTNNSGTDFLSAYLESSKSNSSLSSIEKNGFMQTTYGNRMDTSDAGRVNGNLSRNTVPGTTLVDTVVVRNLPDDCSAKILREGFNQCGDIKYCEIKAPGVGIIRFDGAKSAQIAIARMNNQNIAGKNLAVEYL